MFLREEQILYAESIYKQISADNDQFQSHRKHLLCDISVHEVGDAAILAVVARPVSLQWYEENSTKHRKATHGAQKKRVKTLTTHTRWLHR